MQKLLRLCLWQAVLSISFVSILSLSIITASVFTIGLPVYAEEAPKLERGIRMRGPKSSDVFPYERYGPITQRDTLWKIALTIRPDSRLSIYQVMQALYQANPTAFVEGNLNHLVEGVYLTIPSFERMMAVDIRAAKKKSTEDDKAWEKNQPNKTPKNTTPAIPNVNKQDLDTVKIEINDQLVKIDSEQQKRLENIQNDVLDSIGGLQAILKENEALRQRLSSFDSQLSTMQKEVAKSKEIKLQMDDMIKLQQALLAKAQAREEELLLEKQQAELEKNDMFSNAWFVGSIITLLTMIFLFVLVLLYKRQKVQPEHEDISFEEKPAEKIQETVEQNSPTETEDALADIDDLSLDEDLSLDDELSLDDDLSIDLLEDEEENEDVIHLDDNDDSLDELDDLDDILLDDDSDDLESGELDQSALDSLLLDVGEDDLAKEEPLASNELDQDDLNDLLGSIDNLDSDDELIEEETTEEPPVEVEATEEAPVEEAASEAPVEEAASEAPDADITDPDDIDALLESMNIDDELIEVEATKEAPVEEVAAPPKEPDAEITDPDDIDALLDSMNIDDELIEAEATEEAPVKEVAAPPKEPDADITDPDDIDALLESMNVDDELIEAEATEEAPVEEVTAPEEPDADITDPDDIDALLDSMNIDDELIEAEATEEAPVEVVAAAEEPDAEITDPDDIDALLDSMNIDDELIEVEATEEAPVEEVAAPPKEPDADITDPDDIDALLESMNIDDELIEAEATEEAPVEEVAAPEEPDAEITDPDDIDALLDSMNIDDELIEAEATEEAAVEEVAAPEAADTEITDPDEIDALLASMDIDAEENNDVVVPDDIKDTFNNQNNELEEEDIQSIVSENSKKIESLTEDYVAPLLSTDFSDILSNKAEVDPINDEVESTIDNEEFDIDQIIDEATQNTVKTPPENQELIEDDVFEVGDDILSEAFDEETLAKLLDENEAEQLTEQATELSPDFSDQNVLAGLLNDDELKSDKASVANEINDIQELDNLNFDELLANIEEESSVTNKAANFNETAGKDDGFTLEDFDNFNPKASAVDSFAEDNIDTEKDFVSVDSLLSASQDDVTLNEPYKKSNIDVGLNDFPEFTHDVNPIDVDIDENGVAAKLDLAKVYIEIGDEDNAEVILKEVVKLGDAHQKAEAQNLLKDLE